MRPVVLGFALLAGCACGQPPAQDALEPDERPDTDEPGADTADTGTPPAIRDMLAVEAASVVIRGEYDFHYFGGRAHLGDLTGDGATDVAAYAAIRYGAGVYLIHGPLQGDMVASDAMAFFPGGQYGSGIGDLDGDGQDDLMVVRDEYPYEHRVWFGPLDPADPPSVTAPDARLRPPHTSADMGSICDANGDGIDDLAISYHGHSVRFALGPLAPGLTGEEGVSVVFDGTYGQPSPSPSRTFLCGRDVTGDGANDLLVADASGSNILWLLDDPSWHGWVEVEQAGVPLGIKNGLNGLDMVGDLTGDGYDDLFTDRHLVDGPLQPDSERYASFEWWNTRSDALRVGDLDGDGFDDLVVGVAAYESAVGAVFLIHGPVAPGVYEEEDADLILRGGSHGSNFGHNLFKDPRSDRWGATAGSTQDTFPKQGHLYLFDGWPGL